MTITLPTERLSDEAVATLVSTAVRTATEMGQPQCIVIVDASAVELATFRMVGARVLSQASARTKARTAASIGRPSSSLPEGFRTPIALATDGAVTGLAGGLPIWRNGVLLGGIGVGSGSGEQDVAVAEAALAAIGATAG